MKTLIGRINPPPEKEHQYVTQLFVDLVSQMIEIFTKDDSFDDIVFKARNKRLEAMS